MSSPARPIPILDLTRYDEELRRGIAQAVADVFASGRFVLGPANEAFEKALADRLGVRHVLGVASGTDALLVGLMALGVGPGDEVVTSPFSFFASAGAVARLGATPVFVDIDAATFNLDPSRLERALTPRTKAIQPVHLYGLTADMDPILEIARRRGIPVFEDACQAIGATHGGRPAGTLATLGAFSFYPTKNLGAAGDAGAVATDDDGLAALVKSLRVHGSTATYFHDRVGGNFRMDALQAAVLSVKLPRLDGWIERRRAIARRYENSSCRCGESRQARPSGRGAGAQSRLSPVRHPRARSRRGEAAPGVPRHRQLRLLSGPAPPAEVLRAPRRARRPVSAGGESREGSPRVARCSPSSPTRRSTGWPRSFSPRWFEPAL